MKKIEQEFNRDLDELGGDSNRLENGPSESDGYNSIEL